MSNGQFGASAAVGRDATQSRASGTAPEAFAAGLRASTIRQHLEAGELIEASEKLADWLVRSPDDVDAIALQAQLLRLCGRYQDAKQWLDRALTAVPTHAQACVEAARLAVQTGASDDALDWFERADRAMPDATDWLGEWAGLAHAMQRTELAAAVAARWCERAPDSAQAWFALGLAHQEVGALDAALAAYERARSLDANVPMLLNNLSALHYTRGEYDAALNVGRQALRAEPNHHLAWTNLANIWLKLFEPAKALIAARRAAALAPDFGLAQLALSNAARESQSWSEAFDAIVHAAKVSGAEPKIQFSVAMLQLMQGDFANGWINFEARWSGSPELANKKPFCPSQRWRGEALAGKTLLIWGEQGHGDAIQFIRFLPLIAERVRDAGGHVICCCFRPLYELFKRSLAGSNVEVLPSDLERLPPFDYQIPLASLPLALGVTLESLPAPATYLVPDTARVEWWRNRIGGSARLKAGLVWTGSRDHQRNPVRAVPPERYAEAFSDVPGVDWYSLQPGAAEDVERMARAGLSVIDRTSELASFDDTAALIANLDVVVTVCTSVAHLAAALGRPTWLLLDVNPHWVWMTGRRDSPWYPTVRLYRQRSYRDWTAPLAELRADLEQAARQASAQSRRSSCVLNPR
jgi:tetratricopeptide (TPR) repeat protein